MCFRYFGVRRLVLIYEHKQGILAMHSVYESTCNDKFGVEQTGIFLQSVIVNVASFWIHLKTNNYVIKYTKTNANRHNTEMFREAPQ